MEKKNTLLQKLSSDSTKTICSVYVETIHFFFLLFRTYCTGDLEKYWNQPKPKFFLNVFCFEMFVSEKMNLKMLSENLGMYCISVYMCVCWCNKFWKEHYNRLQIEPGIQRLSHTVYIIRIFRSELNRNFLRVITVCCRAGIRIHLFRRRKRKRKLKNVANRRCFVSEPFIVSLQVLRHKTETGTECAHFLLNLAYCVRMFHQVLY